MLDFAITELDVNFEAEDPLKNETGNQNLIASFWECLNHNFPRLKSAGIFEKHAHKKSENSKQTSSFDVSFLFPLIENVYIKIQREVPFLLTWLFIVFAH